jgi:hypothetical protein
MKYADLSDKAKERARNAWRDAGEPDDWWDDVYKDVSTTGALMGIEIANRVTKTVKGESYPVLDISFNIGEGASYSGVLDVAGLNDCLAKVSEHVGDLNTGHELYDLARRGEALYEMIVAHWTANRLSGVEEDDQEHPGCGPDMRVLIQDRTGGFSTYVVGLMAPDDIDLAMSEYVAAYADYIYEQLQAEEAYIYSDTYVVESILSNDADFDEDGNPE